jgi:DNA-binding response OmpR family regulator
MEKKKFILVIEDEEDLLEILEDSLKSAGYNVICGGNGSEGLFKFKNQKFDLVITDIKMPKLDGIEVVKNVRKDDKYKDIPIIVASGNVTDFKPELSLFENLLILEKPYKKKDILEIVDKAISISKVEASEKLEFEDVFIDCLKEKSQEMLSIVTREKVEASETETLQGPLLIDYDLSSVQLIIGNEFLGNLHYSFESKLASEIANGLSQSEKGTSRSTDEALNYLYLFTRALFVKTGELLKLKKIKIRRTPFSVFGTLDARSKFVLDKSTTCKSFQVTTNEGVFKVFLVV